MSYCRWTCMNNTSDVYCYEAQEGWKIHLTDGRSFTETSEENAAIRLIALREQGITVPEWAIETLIDESKEK